MEAGSFTATTSGGRSSLERSSRSRALDPLLGELFGDEAMKQAREVVRIDPNFVEGHRLLGALEFAASEKDPSRLDAAIGELEARGTASAPTTPAQEPEQEAVTEPNDRADVLQSYEAVVTALESSASISPFLNSPARVRASQAQSLGLATVFAFRSSFDARGP